MGKSQYRVTIPSSPIKYPPAPFIGSVIAEALVALTGVGGGGWGGAFFPQEITKITPKRGQRANLIKDVT